MYCHVCKRDVFFEMSMRVVHGRNMYHCDTCGICLENPDDNTPTKPVISFECTECGAENTYEFKRV